MNGSQTPSEGLILVVDDFELNRDMLTRRLGSRGFQVYAADSGRAALKLVEDKPFDVVLLDIMMPEMDGFEVLERLRQRFSNTEMAVIMVTAKDHSEDIVRALELGADDYVAKPIDFKVMLARIRTQLKRQKTENALQESEERYALAARGANDGLWDWNLITQKVYFSDRWKAMLGFDRSGIGDSIREWFDRVHPDDLYRLKQAMEAHLTGDAPKFECEYRMGAREGGYRWMLSRGCAVKDPEFGAVRIAGWQTDTTERVEHDILTSLPNRGLFLDRMSVASARRKRAKDFGYAVFYMGIDRFKIINESLGYQMADKLLIQIARRLEQFLRPGDTLARLGGDEFSVLVEDIHGVARVSQIANRIKEKMASPFAIGQQDIHITFSIGIVLCKDREENPEELLRMAHAAMERAKVRGKDCFEFYQEKTDEATATTLQMENELRRALERQELFLAYQPQIDTASGQVVGVEALLRWNSEQFGLVSPGRFIPLAEETGLILPIGAWVMETACRQNQEWQAKGLRPIRIGVNLSSRQFRQSDLAELVIQTLDQTGLDARWLELELTESLLLENVEQTIMTLKRLHDMGLKISLDDFGTGYSSLSYLKRFHIDTLKIDQSFVRDITNSSDDAAISSAIIGMAHSLRMSVIAEGVETRDHWTYLKELGCDEMQGYFFSKPTTPEAIEALLREDKRFE